LSLNRHMSTPFRDGFASLWHDPALLAAELTWRWCFGLAAWGLLIASIAFFLNSLTVSRADELFLRSFQPQLLSKVLHDIFRGSLSRFVVEQSVVILAMTLLWSLAATTGRTATLHRLVFMFRGNTAEETATMEWNFASVFVLQWLRIMWSLIAAAVSGVLFCYGIVMASSGYALRAAFALSFGFAMACFVGVVLNWFFGIAPLFCIGRRTSAVDAFDESVAFTSRHGGRLILLAFAFLALKLIWAATMGAAILLSLNWLSLIGWGWTALVMAVVALVYFAGADLLYMARLGAYVSLAEDDAIPAFSGIETPLNFKGAPEFTPVAGPS
jgi:hypothetical protein